VTQARIHFQRSPDFVFRKIVEELVLVPIRRNVADMDTIYTLNEVGAFLWERLQMPTSLDELEAAVLAEYDADADTVAADVAAFLGELISIGAVSEV